MRIFAVGIGGAGCRIVDILYGQDSKSGRSYGLEAVTVERDSRVLRSLTHMPPEGRLFYAPLDPLKGEDIVAGFPTEEVVMRLHSLDPGNMDAIFLFCGLGGMMSRTLPALIEAIRTTMSEPIFGVFILPSSGEGMERSASAADDLDALSPLLDGVILFDNQTWNEKAETVLGQSREKKAVNTLMHMGRRKHSINELFRMTNDAIARRMGLLLRAGEYTPGTTEVGEVVLDSGEVLNTIGGMGFITIGYAAERLSREILSFRKILRPSDYFVETAHRKASRIVELAKKAIYEDMSTPCDLTSAQKALILIAGPSHELNMKGFMTVRRWIDRSIRGLEVRSGDYPIRSTGFVAIIVVLAGVSNIPRVEELRQIRSHYRDVQSDGVNPPTE